MSSLLTAVLFFLWLPTTLQGLLYHTYLWQLKEYRLDRMFDFYRANRMMIIRTTIGWLLWSGLTLFLPLLGMIGLVGLAASALRQLERRQLRRPIFTGKAILILAGGGGMIAIIWMVSMIALQLWWVLLPYGKSLPGSELFSSEMRTLTILFTLTRALAPIFVALAVGALYLPSEIQKRQVIQRAAAKVAAVKPKNIIGITGSYGKTSTKTFLATILHANYHTFSTAGGTNINIAIAQQILRELELDHEQMVIEMAAYTQGEIASICRTTPPNIGIWLSVNEQHLSLFGGIEGTINAKYELIAALPLDGVAILNGDDPRIMQKCAEWPGRKVIFSLKDPTADFYATDIIVEPEMLHFTLHAPRVSESTSQRVSESASQRVSESTSQRVSESASQRVSKSTSQRIPNLQSQISNHPITQFSIPVAGRHNLSNLLAAIAAALDTGMDLIEISRAAEGIRSLEGTLAPRVGRKGTLLIDSSYSSNPTGVRAALEYLSIFEGKKKIMLFPGIIELGDETDRIHRELGKEIAKVCGLLILIKDDFAEPILQGIQNKIEVLRGLDDSQILQRIVSLIGPDTVILFEGRGTGRFFDRA